MDFPRSCHQAVRVVPICEGKEHMNINLIELEQVITVLQTLRDMEGPFDDGSTNCSHCNRPLIIVTYIKAWNSALDHAIDMIQRGTQNV